MTTSLLEAVINVNVTWTVAFHSVTALAEQMSDHKSHHN